VGALLGDVLQACRTHRVLLEARFAGTVAAVAVLEGLGRSLDPDLDILQAAAPVVLKAAAQRAAKRLVQAAAVSGAEKARTVPDRSDDASAPVHRK
jgi:predicted unusual protein kinase regulating ubiquinone biosynthesis (AarF/ABC1/UbiB family)